MEGSMRKPQVLRSVPAQTSSSQEPQRSTADPQAMATTSNGSPFFVEGPSVEWLENLHGFAWLRHFEAVGSEPTQEHVRQLIAHWMRAYGQNWSDVPWRPHVIARRLMTWASHGRFILSNAEI